jgi:hypothetical protein
VDTSIRRHLTPPYFRYNQVPYFSIKNSNVNPCVSSFKHIFIRIQECGLVKRYLKLSSIHSASCYRLLTQGWNIYTNVALKQCSVGASSGEVSDHCDYSPDFVGSYTSNVFSLPHDDVLTAFSSIPLDTTSKKANGTS